MDKVVGGLLEQSRPDVRRRYDNQGLSRSTSVDDSHQSGMLLFALCATVCTKPIFKRYCVRSTRSELCMK